jgi:hypothetical protein
MYQPKIDRKIQTNKQTSNELTAKKDGYILHILGLACTLRHGLLLYYYSIAKCLCCCDDDSSVVNRAVSMVQRCADGAATRRNVK